MSFMNLEIKAQELQYFLIPGENPPRNAQEIYTEAFRCWRFVWSQAFKELDGIDQLFSDDFTRQTAIGCIFIQSKCIALAGYHAIDFRFPTTPFDSWFKVWPDGVQAALTREGSKVMIATNVTVDSDFRGKCVEGVGIKDLICSMMIKSLLSSDADVMAGTMRCNRGMQKVAQRLGGTTLLTGVALHGVEVELVGFYRRKILSENLFVSDSIVEFLWKNRKEFTKSQMRYPEDEWVAA